MYTTSNVTKQVFLLVLFSVPRYMDAQTPAVLHTAYNDVEEIYSEPTNILSS